MPQLPWIVIVIAGLVLVAVLAAIAWRVLRRAPDVARARKARDVNALLRALRYKRDPSVRCAAAEALGDVAAGEPAAALAALPELYPALQDPEVGVRAAAAAALGRIADTSALVPLSAALRDGAVQVALAACGALARMGPLGAPPLVAALRDEREDVRAAAGLALCTMGAPAVEPLVAALQNPKWGERARAAVTLSRLALPLQDVVARARSTAALVAALRDPRDDVRAAATAALVEISADAVTPLSGALHDDDPQLRQRAAVTIGRLGDARSVIPLIAALRDPEPDVRQAAVAALGSIGEPAVEPLVERLRETQHVSSLDTEQAAEHAAVRDALGAIGAPSVTLLSDIVMDGEASRETRLAAVETLELIGLSDPLIQAWGAVLRRDWQAAQALGYAAVDPLSAALQDTDWSVRRCAAAALDQIGAPVSLIAQAWHAIATHNWPRAASFGDVALAPLLSILRDDDAAVRQGAATALGGVAPQLAGISQRTHLLEALLALFDDRGQGVARAAAQAAGRIGALAMDRLVALLADHARVARVRENAALALGYTGDARAVAPLLAALREDRWTLRAAAAAALGQIGAPGIDALCAALDSPAWHVRWAAVHALGEIGDARAALPLRAAMRDEEKYVRWAAAGALERLGLPEDAATQAWYAVTRRDWSAAEAYASDAVAPLVSALHDRAPEIRQAAADVLARIGEPAIDPLARALADDSAPVRQAAAEVLGHMRATGAIEALMEATRDAETPVRLAAVQALGAIGDTRAARSLVDTLKDPDAAVRQAAAAGVAHMGAEAEGPLLKALIDTHASGRWLIATALGGSGDARALEALLAAIRDHSPGVRRAAAEALGGLRDPRVMAPLLQALGDADSQVRAAAVRALYQAEPEPQAVLVGALKDPHADVRHAAAEALRQNAVRSADATERARLATLLEDLLSADASPRVRSTAAEGLGQLGVPSVVLLAAALEDRERDVRRAAGEAVERVGLPSDQGTQAWYAAASGEWARAAEIGAAAVEPLLVAFRDEENAMHRAAADALARIGAPAVPALLEALKEGSPVAVIALGQIADGRAAEPLIAVLAHRAWGRGVRRSAARALGRLGDARAVVPLLDALDDEDAHVRKAAADALDRLGWQPGLDEQAASYWATKARWDKCLGLGTLAVPALVVALGDHENGAGAAETLGQIGDAGAIGPLISALDSDHDVSRAAASALASFARHGKLDDETRERVLGQIG